MADLAKGTEIPAATLNEIFEWFQFRGIPEPERFKAYFSRELRKDERQYLLQLRNDMTTWDPMVSDYMERQIVADETGSSNMTTTGTTTSKKTGSASHKRDGEDVTDTHGKSGNVRTMDTEDTLTGSSELSGTDSVEQGQLRTDNLRHERSLTSKRTDNTEQLTSQESMTNEIGDSVHLAGTTPDSSTYGTGSQIGLKAPDESMPDVLHETGAPAALNWQYTGEQSEDIAKKDSVGRELGSTQNTGDVTTEDTGDSTDTGTVETEGHQSTTYGRKDTENETRKQGGTISDAGENTGQTIVKYDSTLTDTQDLTDTGESHQEQAGETGKKLDHRERYSGRHESPTELLRKAQSYIIESNSLEWLLSQLEHLFDPVLGWR